ncbi:MAG: 2-dehydropantoate 2-reductase [Tenericutes bacterium]|nr:2-dehydropantoate 2-reductase [Mycoplasmatota bacterium]
MKVAIYGAGAMGTILGAYVTRAGYNVDLITRNESHVEGMKKAGAQIIGKANFVQKVRALLPDEMNDKYDIILLMTKQINNVEIVKKLLPYLSDRGMICTMQNGLPEKSVSEIIGIDRTFGCAMSWGATMIGNGVVKLTSEENRETLTFSIGKFGDNDDELFNYTVEMLSTMGNVIVEENFIGARWAKLLVNSAFSGPSTVFDATFGEVAKNKKSRILVQKIIKECIEVANAANIKIEPIQGKDIVKLLDYNSCIKRKISYLIIPLAIKKHRLIKSSMLNDIAKGRKSEIFAINGVICEYGTEYDVKTPINDRIVEVVNAISEGKYSSSWNNLEMFKDLL